MNALGWRLAALAILLALLFGACLGARVAWTWQDAQYGKVLAEQADSFQRERESAAVKVIDWQEAEQARRRGLEDRLKAITDNHWKELNDAQQAQARLRDRLATADLRLSVLLDATADEGSGGGVPATTGAGGLVHGALRAYLEPAHAQRIIAITDEGDRGMIALQACQAYVREVSK